MLQKLLAVKRREGFLRRDKPDKLNISLVDQLVHLRVPSGAISHLTQLPVLWLLDPHLKRLMQVGRSWDRNCVVVEKRVAPTDRDWETS